MQDKIIIKKKAANTFFQNVETLKNMEMGDKSKLYL
jgi:hypothetical protein